MRRVAVLGCSGAGKTTFARRLSEVLDLPHVELDGLYHQPGWQPLPRPEFRARLGAALDAAEDGWVTCGNYESKIAGLHVARADTVIWLDMPRSVVMRRVVLRTLRRTLTRQELWNGNRERWSNLTSWDPEKSIIRWAWVRWPVYRERYEQRMHDGTWAHAEVVRLRTAREVSAFLRRAAAATAPARARPG